MAEDGDRGISNFATLSRLIESPIADPRLEGLRQELASIGELTQWKTEVVGIEPLSPIEMANALGNTACRTMWLTLGGATPVVLSPSGDAVESLEDCPIAGCGRRRTKT
jgi:hypothetical protein